MLSFKKIPHLTAKEARMNSQQTLDNECKKTINEIMKNIYKATKNGWLYAYFPSRKISKQVETYLINKGYEIKKDSYKEPISYNPYLCEYNDKITW